MTAASEATPASSPEPHVCAHCDDSTPHEHVDTRGVVLRYRRHLVHASTVRGLLAVALLVVGVIAAGSALLAGIAAWAVMTGVGILAAGIVNQRSGADSDTPAPRAVIVAAIAGAAVLPLLAYGIAAWLGSTWPIALAAACGWLAVALCVEVLRDRGLIATLTADTRAGEAAREGVTARQPTPPFVDAGLTLVTGALLAGWIMATGAVPLLVITLVPLQVALTILTRQLARASARRYARS